MLQNNLYSKIGKENVYVHNKQTKNAQSKHDSGVLLSFVLCVFFFTFVLLSFAIVVFLCSIVQLCVRVLMSLVLLLLYFALLFVVLSIVHCIRGTQQVFWFRSLSLSLSCSCKGVLIMCVKCTGNCGVCLLC